MCHDDEVLAKMLGSNGDPKYTQSLYLLVHQLDRVGLDGNFRDSHIDLWPILADFYDWTKLGQIGQGRLYLWRISISICAYPFCVQVSPYFGAKKSKYTTKILNILEEKMQLHHPYATMISPPPTVVV